MEPGDPVSVDVVVCGVTKDDTCVVEARDVLVSVARTVLGLGRLDRWGVQSKRTKLGVFLHELLPAIRFEPGDVLL